MSRTNWKQVERDAASLFDAKRFPANMGGRLDFEGHYFIGQVKNPKVMSLAALEALAIEMCREGKKRDKVGVVVVKRSAGSGIETPMLVVMDYGQWIEVKRLIAPPLGGS